MCTCTWHELEKPLLCLTNAVIMVSCFEDFSVYPCRTDTAKTLFTVHRVTRSWVAFAFTVLILSSFHSLSVWLSYHRNQFHRLTEQLCLCSPHARGDRTHEQTYHSVDFIFTGYISSKAPEWQTRYKAIFTSSSITTCSLSLPQITFCPFLSIKMMWFSFIYNGRRK